MSAMIDDTHDPSLSSWVPGANGHPDFPIQNLPFGMFLARGADRPRIGIAIGNAILDLAAVGSHLSSAVQRVLGASALNDLLALPAEERIGLRRAVSRLLSVEHKRRDIEPHLREARTCRMVLPTTIGDYTDFYVGIHHARNVGKLFRPDNPLLPNYMYVPIGYHGRASSVRPSGSIVRRPSGQRKGQDLNEPVFAASERLDYEVELGVWIGAGNDAGTTIPIETASQHVAGLSLLNDWSARDIQAWEYQPLGPFLSKSFHTSVSPWVVTMEALAPFRVAQPPRPDADPQPLPYLRSEADQRSGAFAITLEAWLSTSAMRSAGSGAHRLSSSSATDMYWTVAQMVTHHASNGCNLAPGDLLGTGTISAADPSGFGSLLEITQGGRFPLSLPTGESRTFLEDGDEVVFTGRAERAGFVSIGFGECVGVVKGAAD